MYLVDNFTQVVKDSMVDRVINGSLLVSGRKIKVLFSRKKQAFSNPFCYLITFLEK